MEKLNDNEVERISDTWFKSSEDDFDTMLSMFKSKHYDWALFVGHLSVEKLLKAYYVKKHRDHAPFTHNLLRLAELCRLDIEDENIKNQLLDITTFNLNVRYDDYKTDFHKKCTVDFTKNWVQRITELRLWIQKKF